MIEICDYDPHWVDQFQLLRDQVLVLLADRAAQPPCIEHVGSTAVAGCAAKDVIDILIGLPSDGMTDERVANALARLGCKEVSVRSTVTRRIFVRRHKAPSTNIHVTEVGGPLWTLLTATRDYLTAHPAVLTDYVSLKRRLARQHPNDARAYSAGKLPFFRDLGPRLEASHGASSGSFLRTMNAVADDLSWPAPPPAPGPIPAPGPTPVPSPLYWYPVGPKTDRVPVDTSAAPGSMDNPSVGPGCYSGVPYDQLCIMPTANYTFVQLGIRVTQGYEVQGTN